MKTSDKIALRSEANEICGCMLEDCPIDGNLLAKVPASPRQHTPGPWIVRISQN